MNTSSDNQIKTLSIIQAMKSGFNTIAERPYLILFPILLDLFLWFGPAWRVFDFFEPYLLSLSDLSGFESTEFMAILESFQQAWQDLLANFNLAIALRTLPIGIPSLMVSKPSFLNPLGNPLTINLQSSNQILMFWFLFLLTGFFFGNLYFQTITRQVITEFVWPIKRLFKSYLQILLMPLVLLIILSIMVIPLILLVTMISLISPAISQFLLFLAGILIVWAITPLLFTPHGIFLYQQNIIEAMLTSIKIVRLTMGKTIWFILLSFVLVQGLDNLWRSPHVDNWFLLVGIIGRAFVVTAVITASFHYYLEATKISQAIITQEIQAT